MVAVQYVFKRGSVYWWRRRLPTGTGPRACVPTELSLHTKELELARTIAAEVTLASHRLLPGLKTKMISPEDAKKILVQVALDHSAYLDSIMAYKQRDRDPQAGRRGEICTAWALRLYAAQGDHAEVGPAEERELRTAGLDDEMLESVKGTLSFYKQTGFGRPGNSKLESILAQHGISPVDVHLRQAEALYMRGMSAALLNTERRWSGLRGDDIALLQAALMDAPAVNATPPSMAVNLTQGPTLAENAAALAPPLPAPVAASSSAEDVETVEEDDSGAPELRDDQPGLVELVSRAAEERVASEEWDIKAAQQQVSLAKLFVRFVGHDRPGRMRQSDIANFKSIFYRMPKNYGRSPKDFTISVADILKRAEDLPAEQRGFSISTINRHMTQLGNIVSICKHAGYPFESYEGVSGLRSKKRGDTRAERGKFSTQELQTIFKLPIWNGSAGENDRYSTGQEVIHDAAYWVPIIAALEGARREEICGLLLDDVEIKPEGDFDMPCLRIETNAVRRVKNPQSKRRVPLHPELLRLGFADYVEELRQLGHTLLFPELRAAAEGTPMGDVFDDNWQKMREAALPTAKEERKVFHSLRHWCNNEMKQAGVAAEVRKDILGHTNGDVNEGRYAEMARLRVMADALGHLPHPTSHLVPHPVRVLESVRVHEARKGRKKRPT